MQVNLGTTQSELLAVRLRPCRSRSSSPKSGQLSEIQLKHPRIVVSLMRRLAEVDESGSKDSKRQARAYVHFTQDGMTLGRPLLESSGMSNVKRSD